MVYEKSNYQHLSLASAAGGVTHEGFMIITFPVRRAGAILPVARRSGKFQGTMAATTPMGVYRVITVLSLESSTMSSGSEMSAMPRIQAIAASVSASAWGT